MAGMPQLEKAMDMSTATHVSIDSPITNIWIFVDSIMYY